MLRFLDEGRAAGLDVHHEEEFLLARLVRVAADDPVRLAEAVLPVSPRVRQRDRAEQLKDWQELLLTAVGSRLAFQPPRGVVRRADAERAERVCLRRPVEADHPVLRKHALATSRQLADCAPASRRATLAGSALDEDACCKRQRKERRRDQPRVQLSRAASR